jgi:hypothetical protein
VGVLGQQDRHLSGLQQQAGMDFVSHREIYIPVFVTGRQRLQSAHIKDFNTLATAPEKLQIGVTSVGLEASLKPSPRLIALQEQVQGIAIRGDAPGFSRREGRKLAHDLWQATHQTIPQQLQSLPEPASRADERPEIFHCAQH